MKSVLLIFIGIVVEIAKFGNTQDFAVRLSNSIGNKSKEGRLEIYYSGRWGTVCDEGFTDVSARVACASLGFGYVGEVIPNRHGAGSGPIWLTEVNCTGVENGIEQCVHNGWSEKKYCIHSKLVSISCECGIRNFSEPTGKMSSPNYPSRYTNNLDCHNYITIPSAQTIIITFLEFLTQPTSDYLTIMCASGNEFATPRYSGLEFPAVLTISSCNIVNIQFHTDNCEVYKGFSLTYNITSDVVIGGITMRPSNAFPRSDRDDPIIFNCTTTSTLFPWWTFNNEIFGNVTVTNSTCGVITSLRYNFWLNSETFGPGSCNLIGFLPAHILNSFAGSLVCTDSTLSSARAMAIPINPELRSTRSTNSLVTGIDIIRDWNIKISCNSSFTYQYSPVFTYFLYSGGPVVHVRIVSTYWTSEGKVVAGTDTSNSSSYVLVKAPQNGVIPRYTCNVVCDLFSNISDINADSAIELSFSTDSVSVTDLVCAKRNFSGIMGQISSSDSTIAYTNDTDCYNYYITVPAGQTIIVSFLALNAQNNHAWVTISCESGNAFRSPRYSGSLLPAVLTISSCNILTVHLHTDISISDTGFSLTYDTTSDTVKGGITTKPSNAFPRSDKDDPIIFNCTTASEYLPWWTINDKSSRNYTVTNSTCEVITSALYSSWFKTETLGLGSCNLIVVAPADKRHLLAGTVVCTDSTLASARAILAPIDLALIITRNSNSLAAVTDIVRDEETKISCRSSFTFWESRLSLDFTYFLYVGGPVVQMRISRTHWTSEGNDVSSTDTSDWSHSASYVSFKAPIGVIPRYTCNIVFYFFSNISDISGDSSVTLSFSTDPVDVFYWPTEDNLTMTGHNNGQILTSGLLYCNVYANPPATYKWINENNDKISEGQSIQITHSGKYTCNVSNTIRGQYHQQSKSIHVQVVEDKTNQNRAVLILLGVAVLTIIVILAIHLNRPRHQQERNAAADGNAYELRQRAGRSNNYGAGCRNSDDVVEPEYDKLNIPQRRGPIPPVPSNCAELSSHGRELSPTGEECNVYESYLDNDIVADSSDHVQIVHPGASQQIPLHISDVNDERVIED